MPPQIGQFISKYVYEGQLESWEKHPVQHELSCQFIDVADGCEKPDGNSFKVRLKFYLIFIRNAYESVRMRMKPSLPSR